MNQNQYALEVLVNGRPVKEYYHDSKTFVEGRENTQYSLRIRNNSWQRVLAVVSVDGLDVLTGKPAVPEGGGYIIAPWSTVEIKGFRESNNAVGAFLFTHKSASYAAGQGMGFNTGIIGVRIFDEVPNPEPVYIAPIPEPTPWRPRNRIIYASDGTFVGPSYSGASPFITGFDNGSFDSDGAGNFSSDRLMDNGGGGTSCSAGAPVAAAGPAMSYMEQSRGLIDRTFTVKKKAFSLGTTWGKRVQDRVAVVEFERNNNVAAFDLYYASRSDLRDMGVNLREEGSVSFPQAFPTAYAKPPTNWRG